ncbi:MAG TPA: hypothetical protein VEB86_19390 [Chryseosolibacter sp.]|nr:hypothetical protein [Chryseosolibacter sp.]
MKAASLILIAITLSASDLLAQTRKGTPDYFVLQYAGSIGYISAGIGYDIIKSRARTSVHFGTVPKNQGGPLNVFCGKFFYIPWNIRVTDRTYFRPADIGFMASYHMGEDFKQSVPDYFSGSNYYWWHTSLRLHLATETSFSVKMEPNRFFNSVTGYIEFNVNDLYLISYISNARTLDISELVKGGVGARFNF